MYFANVLTSKAHSLYLPKEAREDILKLVSTGQKGKVSRENAPFRRQVDFWLLCLGTAISTGTAGLEEPPSSWGYKFVDTREVQLPNYVYDLLAVVAFDVLKENAEEVDDPRKIIDTANGLAGSACPIVLKAIKSSDLRVTPLTKTLNLMRDSLN